MRGRTGAADRLLRRQRGQRHLRRLLLTDRAQMAVKGAIAATLAWLAAELVSARVEGFENYLYYAPLGALVAVYPTVATSLRNTISAGLSIALGGAIGLTVHLLLEPSLLSLAVTVGVGVAAGGLPHLGEQRSWVPVVALFTLLIGGTQPAQYALAYLGLALMGAAIGVAVGMAIPALRLTPGHDALRSVATLLGEQLDDLADALRLQDRPDEEGWHDRIHSVRPVLDRMRHDVAEAADAQRGNPRARRRGYPASTQLEVSRGLERVALLVEDLVDVLVTSYRQDLPHTALDPDLALAVADAIERLATLVRSYPEKLLTEDQRVRDAEQALNQVQEAFARRRDLDTRDVAVLGAVVANLDRSLSAVVPVRLTHE
ncbi:MAG TPA: hypothetical protein VFX52_00415 [Nocardioidaceae bacterium]|nr:hypothetical protein [Nocardioidaceae bacterium]